MQSLLNNKKLLLPLLLLLFALFFYIAYTAAGTYDSGDGIRHYLVSRYAWKHPELLLYSWGKPFFTLISSPFSRFGLLGINVFNICCALLSGLFCFRIAQQLNLQYALLAVLFLFFTPCYFPTLNSGLTEPFFGLALIASIYLLMQQRFAAAAILASFLPFIRAEGYLLLPLFFIVMTFRGKLKHALLLGSGTVLYTIIGAFYYRDLFWLSTQNPYKGENADIYGHGSLFHFAGNYNFLWGTTLTALFVTGIIAIAAHFIRHKKTTAVSFFTEELFLIYGSFFIYFVAHSVFWWKGLAGSLGLLRVMAGIAPCFALICLRGFNMAAIPVFTRFRISGFIIIPVMLFFIVRSPFKHFYFPYQPDGEQTVMIKVGDWYKSSPFKNKKVFYLYPYLAHVLNRDPFDGNTTGELWSLYPNIREWGYSVIPDSTLIIWDAHFGPNECRIPADTLFNDLHFEYVRAFRPATPFTVLGGYPFEVYLFRKTGMPQKMVCVFHEFFGLEDPRFLSPENIKTLSKEKAFSGSTSSKLSEKNEYSAVIRKPADSLRVFPGLRRLEFKAKVSGRDSACNEAKLVVSVDDADGRNLYWSGKLFDAQPVEEMPEWKTVSASFFIPPDLLQSNCIVKFYIWNPGKKDFYADDLEISCWAAEKQ